MSRTNNKKKTKVVVAIRSAKVTNNNNNNNSSKNKKKISLVSKKTMNNILPKNESDAACYKGALVEPFRTGCEGVRIPNFALEETRTYRTHGVFPCISDGSGAIQLALLPSVSASILLIAGTTSGATTNPYTVSTSMYPAVSEGTMQAGGSVYRTVAAGFRIKNLLPFSSITGRVWVIPFVCGKPYIPTSYLGNGTLVSAANILDVYSGTTVAATMINAPGAREFTIDELMDNVLECTYRPCGPGAFEWRTIDQSVPTINAVDSLIGDYQTVDTATGAVKTGNNNNRGNSACCSDMLAFTIVANGLPVSTASFEVEYVYHYELNGTNSSSGTLTTNQLVAVTRGVKANRGKYEVPESIVAAVSAIAPVALRAAVDLALPGNRTYRSGMSFLSKLLIK
jgi:hypothetical protein